MSASSGTESGVRFAEGQILRVTRGRLMRGHTSSAACGISTDTRTLKEGELFVALKGPNYNGHDFLPEAVERGAWGAIIQKGERFSSRLSGGTRPFAVIETKDTLRALGDLAEAHRARFSPYVVAITGSVGKTTVKDMVAQILTRKHSICSTEGNHNNLVGVPQTLFELRADHEFLLVELGTDRPGEIARLVEMVRPNLGVITQVTESHLERFGDLVSVAEEKAELFRALGSDGKAVLREEVVFDSLIRARTEAPVTTFGLSGAADVRGMDLHCDEAGCMCFRVVRAEMDVPVHLSICGRHQVWNALAALTICQQLGVNTSEIVPALEAFRGGWGRMQRRRMQAGAWLIDDVYNANPASVRAAVETLAAMDARSRLLVLGDMLDLGAQTERLHRQIGREIGRWPVDDLILCGERWEAYVEGAMEGGMTPEQIHPFSTHEEAARYVKGKLRTGDVILVKGSRATHMERICEVLGAEESSPARSKPIRTNIQRTTTPSHAQI
jgi:UDP-N-acetylmuramoyl-tripeptide--D-alanyl-D-alanine ligase